MAELRLGTGIFGIRGPAFCFLRRQAVCGSVVYFAFPRWAAGAPSKVRKPYTWRYSPIDAKIKKLKLRKYGKQAICPKIK